MEVRLNNDLIVTLPTVEEFMKNSEHLDAGYGKDLFTIMNVLFGFTEYNEQTKISTYISDKSKHPYTLAALYQPSIKALNEHLFEIVSGIQHANPERVLRDFTWLEKLLHKDIEEKAIYVSGVKTIIARYDMMNEAIEHLKLAVRALREIRRTMLEILPYIEHIIKEGYRFIDQHQSNENSPYRDNLDRFNRQLLNVVAFQRMAHLNIQQVENYIELSQATLDRTLEITTVLIPLWRSLYVNQIDNQGNLKMESFADLGDLYQQVIQELRLL